MIQDRNLTSHTYNRATADAIAGNILERYLPCYQELREALHQRQQQGLPSATLRFQAFLDPASRPCWRSQPALPACKQSGCLGRGRRSATNRAPILIYAST